MRTNIVLDDELVAQAMRVSQAKSKRELVDLALRELVERAQQRRLRALKGRGLIDPDYDLRKVRERMLHDAG
ncbi:MAG: type II toxin-antitoxin system VapB family antitoxin [gamma proteobacterium symbiont of Bathyaustriella thionipta]|nr:type II toxin-antitoxin system VapB family antitoxin [gamma proteobacterium symbiont of Bathyaustriella thionipta]